MVVVSHRYGRDVAVAGGIRPMVGVGAWDSDRVLLDRICPDDTTVRLCGGRSGVWGDPCKKPALGVEIPGVVKNCFSDLTGGLTIGKVPNIARRNASQQGFGRRSKVTTYLEA